MDSGDLGGTTHEALESASGKRAKAPSQKKRDDEQQKQDKRRKKEAAATTSAKHAATQDQNLVHDPSPAEVQAFVSNPAQQATRNAANAARFQDRTPASRLNPILPDKRALHTNQLTLQVYESRQATGTNPTSLSVPPHAGQTQQAASVFNSINGNGATINRNASVQDIHVEPGASAHRSTVMPPPPANSHPSYTSITSTTHMHSQAQLAIRHPTNAPPPTPT
ncbi:hypothetical protein FRC07_004248 [Ceratobasidium sp. 392]|nr:hypothetical protein FRC07_004248 [Ceratobasidium sp. 392]